MFKAQNDNCIAATVSIGPKPWTQFKQLKTKQTAKCVFGATRLWAWCQAKDMKMYYAIRNATPIIM